LINPRYVGTSEKKHTPGELLIKQESGQWRGKFSISSWSCKYADGGVFSQCQIRSWQEKRPSLDAESIEWRYAAVSLNEIMKTYTFCYVGSKGAYK
jgi:hypothetical protein